MESPADYLDSPMEGDDVAYPCKGCGDILEEGKAFELAGNRWHLNCFRCNTCGTLLDSDANLLLLGDGSLICNNCTYSCSACGNKIEDLAILTGDQAFCATCFRCRNCKRKIENLRYARTSQGIFCMSCHESLMARRRKKSRAAANAKKKDDQSPMLVDKSLPALPPSAILQSAFSPDRETPDSLDTDTPTELSPRPRQGYSQNDSSSRSSSRKPRERSPERTSSEAPTREGLTLPTTTYRNNRHSAISQASDINGGDSESFFIPLALDPSPAPSMTPRSTSETWVDPSKKSKENKAPEKDYFGISKPNGRPSTDSKSRDPSSSSSTPHIAFQEKGRQQSAEETAQSLKDSIRKAQAGGKSLSAKGSPAIGSDDVRTQHASSPKSPNMNGKAPSTGDKFRLGEVPKGKKSGNSRSNSQSEISDSSRSTSGGGLSAPSRKDASVSKPVASSPSRLLTTEKATTPRSSQDSRSRDEADSRPSFDSNNSPMPIARMDSGGTNRSIPRKEIAPGPVKNTISSMSSSSEADTSPSSASSSDASGLTPTVNGKSISGPLALQLPSTIDELVPPSRAPNRPAAPQQKLSDSYMAPRAPPAPPSSSSHGTKDSNASNGPPSSPKLPRWSAGGDFTMDEDMARILGETDESSQSILRRVSNAVRHGRNASEASNSPRHPGHGRSVSETTRTTASPRWPKTPIAEDSVAPRQISSPISVTSPVAGDDPALLRRQLRNSEQRVAELERQFNSEKDLKNLNKKLIEKRKTVSVLDSQTEIMIRQLEVLAGYVERAKDSKEPIDIAELEDSAIKEFVQKLERLKQTMSSSVEQLYEERNDLLEEKNQIVADRDRALVEFEQLSSKNAQLADMNNDLTHQIQERFKAQSGNSMDSPRPPTNGLGIYTHHNKDKSNVSVQLDEASLRPSTGTTIVGSVTTYPQAMEQDPSMEPATVLSAPHVINIRKGQAKKFNWKKGGQSVAKGVSKGFKGAFASVQQERNQQWQGQTGDSIGLPYNMTMAPMESPAGLQPSSLPRSISSDPSKQGGFGLFKSRTMPKSLSNGNVLAPEHASTLFGSDLVERCEYEKQKIPIVVMKCIQEVELRGMDMEGIYRKTGGSGQVKAIQEGFDREGEEYDISDPDIDITAVTSVLKQYFRKLPTPLLTFDIYDRVLESLSIEDDRERCGHLRQTFAMLPQRHRDTLDFLMFHLARVAKRESENLMTPKNLAVVFAPTIMRDHSLEREMTDMHSKNNAVQFVIEHIEQIFGQHSQD
ncbi:related to RGA1-RHO-type GTPase-activating protein for Cdc42p [Phialocephala subalpina]|uniref:Related to RGA1-RHO-type GTPase-activating protein for Cdc42p n=1 Tax=Phialocephala subalpina TaxID=576137 RepID=A0A1L7XBT3_9HELO|nr:related to RGA1-RHO-type GTPase-activating protein for Cdc42p [Phialocephala subalpina]